MTTPSLDRRSFLAALGGTAVLTLWPGLSTAASGGQTRLVVVLLRGAMDGLHLLPPRDDPREDFAQAFIWPVQGRISGRFGNQRVYNGTPKSPHSGMDIAAANGTPVKAPAAGIVTFASPSLYLTGGTVVIDHGAGVSSNFLHLSRIDVKVGDRVEQGQVFAAVGATGRATGPHLHWGMNWFDVRIDPLLVLELAK